MVSGSKLWIVITLGTLAASAHAQQAAPPGQPPSGMPVVTGEMEVTTSRVPEAVEPVPAEITVVTAAELEAQGVHDMAGALSLLAGVTVAPGGEAGPAGFVPELWGLREIDAFLLVVDGVPWGGAFNPAVEAIDLENVERIEVLRGAAPVMYGATAFSGVIQVIHYAPGEGGRRASAWLGKPQQWRRGRDAGVPRSGRGQAVAHRRRREGRLRRRPRRARPWPRPLPRRRRRARRQLAARRRRHHPEPGSHQPARTRRLDEHPRPAHPARRQPQPHRRQARRGSLPPRRRLRPAAGGRHLGQHPRLHSQQAPERPRLHPPRRHLRRPRRRGGRLPPGRQPHRRLPR